MMVGFLDTTSLQSGGTRPINSIRRSFIVKDYGHLMPTMVYNCAFMPSICNNIENWLGYLPVSGKESVFHMDYQKDGTPASKKRLNVRRNTVCRSTWIQNGRCPEDDQPEWSGYESQSPYRRIGPIPAVLSGT